jgi:glycine dehydrogenase subunit 2
LAAVPGIDVAFADSNDDRRLEQIRYSLGALHEATGVGTRDVARRAVDFGFGSFYTSHEPWLIPEPMTLEPSEAQARADLDAYADVLAAIVREAHEDPATVTSAPHRSTVHQMDPGALDDPDRWALTWRAHVRNTAGITREVIDPRPFLTDR